MSNRRPDAGFSLAALIFFAAAASILAAAAVPAYQMQAKREREKELMFRGAEYMRAIQKFQRKFGVYPSSVDQLVQTNGIRFLRRGYKDPITGKDFRLIRINPDGSLAGSRLFARNVNNQPLFGNTQTFGQPPGQQPSPQSAGSQQQQQATQQQSSPQQGFGQQQFGTAQQRPPATQPSGQFQTQPGTTPPFTLGNGGNSPIAGGGVVGIASDSDETSVMVYNQRQKYSEWEFIAIAGQTGQQPGQAPVAPGQAPGQIPGGQPQTNPALPPGFPSPAPQPGARPFGPAPGVQPGPQPFGGGNPGMPTNPFNPVSPGRVP